MSSVIILNVTPCFSYSLSGSDTLGIVILEARVYFVYNFTTFSVCPIGEGGKLYCRSHVH